MNVLVVPEDCRHDGGLVLPIIRRMFKWVGRPANVQVCQDPRYGGINEVLKQDNVTKLIRRYPMVDLFLIIVDRDGQNGRAQQLSRIEDHAADVIGADRQRLVAACAWQEVEVWVLAAMTDLPKRWSWKKLREHPDPKEAFFEPYAKKRGLHVEADQGRSSLAREAAQNYKRIRSKCPEIQELEARL